MAVIAALFDSEADATNAMDRLLREHLEGLDTRVIGPGTGNDNAGGNVVLPVIPATGSGAGSTGAIGPVGGMVGGIGSGADWMNDMDEVEHTFYEEGMREGATLALAKVRDEDVNQVRTLLSMFNARTYTKD